MGDHTSSYEIAPQEGCIGGSQVKRCSGLAHGKLLEIAGEMILYVIKLVNAPNLATRVNLEGWVKTVKKYTFGGCGDGTPVFTLGFVCLR